MFIKNIEKNKFAFRFIKQSTIRGMIFMEKEFIILDLFSGPGGLLEGFLNENFNSIAHIEMDKYASLTLETRLLYHILKNNKETELYFNYLRKKTARENLFEQVMKLDKNINKRTIRKEISTETIRALKNKVSRILNSDDTKEIDVILGGPPCQPYSYVGRSRDPDNMNNDPRNYLYKHFLNFVKHYQPKIFVFENVPGMLNAKNSKIIRNFEEICKDIGYNLEYNILDSSDFLVLQKRKRVIMFGWKKEFKLKYPIFKRNDHEYKVSNLLDDLPSLESTEGNDGPSEYSSAPTKYLIESNIRNSADILIHHKARFLNERDKKIYRKAINKWNNGNERLKYNELPRELIEHKNLNSFLDRFKIVAGNLKSSHSIVAHISKDGHYYIHPDINQARSLTVREAARIQSFPDNYKFEGPRTSQFKQVGNAVPPLMAREIAKEVRKMLEEI